ncbi:MAG: type II toxin-antitoxin system HicB family antitoxin [Fidelibacterota bacterium]
MRLRDNYLKIVEWSDEDNCYIGSVPGWLGKVCHGSNELEVYSELCHIVDEWINIYAEDGIPLPKPTKKDYSGKFVLRTGPELHKMLAIKALNQGESLNQFVVKKLKTLVSG